MQQVTLSLQSILYLALIQALTMIIAQYIVQLFKNGTEVAKKTGKKIDEFISEKKS